MSHVQKGTIKFYHGYKKFSLAWQTLECVTSIPVSDCCSSSAKNCWPSGSSDLRAAKFSEGSQMSWRKTACIRFSQILLIRGPRENVLFEGDKPSYVSVFIGLPYEPWSQSNFSTAENQKIDELYCGIKETFTFSKTEKGKTTCLRSGKRT